MIVIDKKRNTATINGENLTVILDELLSIIALIVKSGNIKKDDLRKILISDKFWDSIECDEDEEE